MRSRRHLPVRPAPRSAFSGYRFPPEVITLAVRWYLRFGLSYRDVEELLAEHGIEVDHVSIYRWVQRFAPEFAEAARARQHVIGDRWHVDETYVKVRGTWRYLFRAIDQFGQVIDVYLSPRRDTAAARRFFADAIGRTRISLVEVTTDRYRVYPRVLDELLPGAFHDTEVHANNPLKTDHGRLKARLRSMRGLKRDRTAKGDRRWPCLRPEPPPRLLRSWDRRTVRLAACARLRRTGPCYLTPTHADRSTSPWLRSTQQCRLRCCGRHPPASAWQLGSSSSTHEPSDDSREEEHMSVHYQHDGIATFPATTEKIFRYMSSGNHQHAAFKSHRLVGVSGDVVTIEAEIYNPDGSTFQTTIEHRLDPPKGIETRMIGGAFDGATFTHTYTSVDGQTKVDLEGDFPEMPGMTETDELAMIDGFFTMIFDDDTATLRTWAP